MPSWISEMRRAGHGRGTPALVDGTSANTALVSHASAHTKGVYVEIHAGVPANCNGFVISALNQVANNAWLIDVAIGSAGNEVVIASNIPIEWGRSLNIHDLPLVFPIRIPEGARVAVRGQSFTGAQTINLHWSLHTGNLGPITYEGAVCESASEANSRGVAITGTGIFELVASASRDYKGIMFMSAADGGTQTGANLQMTYFVGGAAAEKKVFEIEYRELAIGDTAPHFGYAVHRPLPYLVQTGSRWSTRANRANKYINNCIFFL